MNLNIKEVKWWLSTMSSCQAEAEGVLAYIKQLEIAANDQIWITENETLRSKIKAYHSLLTKMSVDLKNKKYSEVAEVLEVMFKDSEKML